jgi:glycosyltransferase involved in cell wall biosynthesis
VPPVPSDDVSLPDEQTRLLADSDASATTLLQGDRRVDSVPTVANSDTDTDANTPRGAVSVRSETFEEIVASIAAEPTVYDLGIVIPMFKETERIAKSVATLAKSTLNVATVQFLFVDDGSNDNTVAVTRAAIKEFGLVNATVLPLVKNVGKGGAVKAGITSLVTNSRFVGFLDADLSLDPSDVSTAFARMQSLGCDLLVGDRVVQYEHQPKFRRIASLVFRAIAAKMTPTGVRDSQCAMKLFKSSVARPLFDALLIEGFAFDVEILVRARLLGLKVSEQAIEWEPQAGSRVNPITDSLRMLREVRTVRNRLYRN